MAQRKDWATIDRLGRVRWLNRNTDKEHSFTPDSTADARKLVGYLNYWEGRVDRWNHVLTDPAKPWRHSFPDPDSAAEERMTFGEYGRHIWKQRLERGRVVQRSFNIHMTELERTRIPFKDGTVLYDMRLTDLEKARRTVETFEAALKTYSWTTKKGLARSYAEHTVRQTIDFVTGVIRAAIEDQVLPIGALGSYEAPVARRRQSKRAMEYRDYLGLRRHEPNRETRLMMDTIAGTGCRLGELMGLDTDDVRQVGGKITVNFVEQEYRNKQRGDLKSVRRKTRDDERTRSVVVAPALGSELLAFIAETGRTGRLWRSTQKPGATPSHENFEWRFRRAVLRATAAGDMPNWTDESLPTPHNLRHSYVSWALGAKISAETIARRTGHSTFSLWKTYAESLSDSEAAMDDHLSSIDPYAATALPIATSCCAHCGLPASRPDAA